MLFRILCVFKNISSLFKCECCIAFVIGDDLLEFHQAVVSTLRDADDAPVPLDPAPMLPPLQPNNPLLTHTNEDMARLSEMHNDLGPDHGEDEADTGKLYVPLLSIYIY